MYCHIAAVRRLKFCVCRGIFRCFAKGVRAFSVPGDDNALQLFFLLLSRGVCMVLCGMWGPNIASQRQAFDGKTVFFSALRRVFSKFRRLYRERASGFYSGPALRKTGAFSSSPFVLTDACAGFGVR